ncbi:MAG: Plug domain-containing protein, partial [Myxococcota bacterium]|nr:Plug domain-containing protein [Myxococcota bacterium]
MRSNSKLTRAIFVCVFVHFVVSSNLMTDAHAQTSPSNEPVTATEEDDAHEQTEVDGEPVEGGTITTEEMSYEGELVDDGGNVTTRAKPRRLPDPGQATSTVTRQEIEERQPRSAPDALRYEAGVFVQQTAHSQGSAFVRGRTGQQTVLMFDDVRLNNSLFRQGPNQYFFTVDSRTIDHIDVVRGSASTRYGTDAIAGAINAVPLEPTFDPEKGFMMRP